MKHKKDMELLKCFLRSAMKIVRDLENFSFEEGLRDLSLFSLEKAAGTPHCSLPVFKRDYKPEVNQFLKMDSHRTRGNDFKLKE